MLKPSIVPMFILELLLVSLFISPLLAVPVSEISPYTSRLWQSGDGLPQDDVQALCQTQEGYLCVGTPQGLARFDGMRFDVMESTSLSEIRSHARAFLCA